MRIFSIFPFLCYNIIIMWIKSMFKNLALSAFFASIIFINSSYSNNAFFGWVILIVFLMWASKSVHIFLHKYFAFSRSLRIRALSSFIVLTILGFVVGFFSWIYKINLPILSLSFFITSLAFSCLNQLVGENDEIIPEIKNDNKQVIEESWQFAVGSRQVMDTRNMRIETD